MALKPTIYKIQVELADSDRNHFDSLALTLALHPSETLERMAARLLAYCLNAGRGLEFTAACRPAMNRTSGAPMTKGKAPKNGASMSNASPIKTDIPARERLIFALDVPDLERARALVDILGERGGRRESQKPTERDGQQQSPQ